MTEYQNYIKNITNSCLLVDYGEYQHSLNSKYIRDKEIISKFKGFSQQLETLIHDDFKHWLLDDLLVKQVIDIISNWDSKIQALSIIAKLLNDLNTNNLLKKISIELVDRKHFIYQDMLWNDISREKNNLEVKINSAGSSPFIKNIVKNSQKADLKINNNERLKILDNRAWDSALLENTVTGFQSYIKKTLQSKLYAKGNQGHIADAEKAIQILSTPPSLAKKTSTPIALVTKKNICGTCGSVYPQHYSRCPKDGFLFTKK